MVVRVFHPDAIYEFLSNPPQRPGEMIEEFQREQLREAAKDMPRTYGFRPIPLASPLKNISGALLKNHGHYSFFIPIEPREEHAFYGIGNIFGKLLRQKGFRFTEISKDCEGYIFEGKETKPAGVILDAPQCPTRDKIISIGTNGAIPRVFGEAAGFRKGVSDLELFIDLLMQACYRKNRKKAADAHLILSGI